MGLFKRESAPKSIIAVSVTPEEKQVVEQLADRMGISMSELCLRALGEYVNKP